MDVPTGDFLPGIYAQLKLLNEFEDATDCKTISNILLDKQKKIDKTI